MPDVESTMRWKVDIAQLKSAMQDAKRSINQANAEFKTATAGMDRWSKSTTGLEAKLTQLNKVLPAQKQQLAVLEAQYAEVVQAQGENSTAAADLKLKIENQRAAIAKTEAGIEKYNGQLEEMQAAEAESQTASSKLSQTISDQEQEVAKLKKAYADAVLEYGENSDEAQELASQIQSLSGELATNKQKLNDAEKAADKFDATLDDTGDSAEEAADGGFTVLKGALANLVTQGINLCIDALKNLASTAAEAWKEFDSGSDIIIAKTGATGAAAEDLQRIYKNVSKQFVGSFDEMGTAVGEVNTRFGVTGQDLEDLSLKFLKFAKLNGTDVNSSVDSVQKALSAFGLKAEDAGHVLDVLNRVGQNTGVSVDKLTSGLISNGTAFQEMGLSVEESAVLMGQMEKSGANTETVMNGLRKALKNATEEGIPLNEALEQLEDSIVNNADETEGLKNAYDTFRKSGDQIYGALKNGTLSFKNITAATEDFGNSVETTFENTLSAPDQFALAIQGIKTDMADVANKFMTKYAPQIEKAIEGIGSVADGLFSAVESAVDFFTKYGDIIIAIITGIATATAVYLGYTTALTVMTEGWMALEIVQKAVAAGQAVLNAVMAANPIGLIIAAIAGLVAAFILLWNNSEEFREFWIGLWEKIKEAISKAKDKITEWIEVIKAKFADFKAKAEEIKNGIAQAWENIKSKTLELKNKVSEFFGNIKSSIQEKIDAAKQKVSDAVDKIKEFLSFEGLKKKVQDLFDGIKEKITSPIESAKELVTSAVEKIKGIFPIKLGNIFSGIKLPHFKISGGSAPWGIGGQGVKPTIGIDWYARGGVFDKGATLIGLGEKGAEAVVPLEHNTEWIGKVAAQLLQDLTAMNHAVSDQSGTLAGTAAVGGSVKTQNVTFNQYNNSPKALSRLDIYRDTNNLLFSSKVRLGNV